MKPIPEEFLEKNSGGRSVPNTRPVSKHEIKARELAGRIISFSQIDRKNDSDVAELIQDTRRHLLNSHALRSRNTRNSSRRNQLRNKKSRGERH